MGDTVHDDALVSINTLEYPGREIRTLSDLILEYLVQIDVDHIFGIPGGAIEPLFDAIARLERRSFSVSDRDFDHKVQSRGERSNNRAIKMVVARHEAGAAFMADGYSRVTGRLGVCCATTGPGTTNLITGVASAYADRIPMLVITPQTALPHFGRHGLQDSSGDAISVVEMFSTCTRYNTFVSHAEQLEGKLFEAIYTAFQDPRGPVHLSIPMDILSQPVAIEMPKFHVATLLRQPKSFDEQGAAALIEILARKERVVIFLGAGCLHDAEIIIKFAELINARIVTTPAGKGCISAYHPLFCGVFGFAGHQYATDVLTSDDVKTVMAIGTTLGELETGGWCSTAILNEKLIHIDWEKENFSRSPMARLHVFGHINSLFEMLISRFSDGEERESMQLLDSLSPSLRDFNAANMVQKRAALSEVMRSSRRASNDVAGQLIKPQMLMCELPKRLAGDTQFFIDAGNSWAWATHLLHLRHSGTYNIGMGFGAMAWAIGASIGASIGGNKAVPTVCMTGDGSYLMSGQEITVAVAEKIPVIFVVLNDSCLGMVKHGQKLGGGEPIAFQIPCVDFAAMAMSVGAKGYAINNTIELLEFDYAQLYQHEGPSLLDIHIDGDEVPPMGARMKTLDR